MTSSNKIGDGLGTQIVNRVDFFVRPTHSIFRHRIAHIRLHRMDLADVAKWLQMKRKIRTAYRDPDPPSTLRQSTHHMPIDKARTSEHSYEPTCLHQFVRHGG